MFSKKKKTKVKTSDFQWIEKNDLLNPFGIRFLDCRPVTLSYMSFTQNQEIAKKFIQLRYASGKLLVELDKSLFGKVKTSLSYKLDGFDEGPLYLAPQMEYKWDIFQFHDQLLISRSWNGKLVYCVPIEFVNNKLAIQEIKVAPSSIIEPEFHKREVDFLIKVHLFGIIVPHPLLADWHQKDTEKLVSYSFSRYGRIGWFGSFEDTTGIDINSYALENNLHQITFFRNIIKPA